MPPPRWLLSSSRRILGSQMSQSQVVSEPLPNPHRPAGAPVVRLDTTLILALAALLIVNSHLEDFYPKRWLAADGLLANCMFFLLSGYGIQSSLDAKRQGFVSYALRRLVRIYPAAIIAIALLDGVLGGDFGRWTLDAYVANFLWPTQFTYVGLIGPFYLLAYVLALPRSRWLTWVAFAAAIALYGYCFAREFPSLHAGERLSLGMRSPGVSDANYVAFFLGGMLLAGRVGGPRARRLPLKAAALAAVTLLYFAVKALMVIGGWHSNLYPVLHVLVALSCALGLAVLTDERVLGPVRRVKLLWVAVVFVGALTLEFYVVHETLIHAVPISRVPFPANILVLLAVVSLLSWLLSRATSPLRDWVDRRTR